jgi:hypothetical protein
LPVSDGVPGTAMQLYELKSTKNICPENDEKETERKKARERRKR